MGRGKVANNTLLPLTGLENGLDVGIVAMFVLFTAGLLFVIFTWRALTGRYVPMGR